MNNLTCFKGLAVCLHNVKMIKIYLAISQNIYISSKCWTICGMEAYLDTDSAKNYCGAIIGTGKTLG